MAETLSIALLLAQTSRSCAQDLISESRANIARLESQIADLQRLCAREYSIIKALQLITAPVRSMPADVLKKIFVNFNANTRLNPLQLEVKDVLAVAQVCSSWRRAALSTPQLWVRLLPILSAGRPLVAATRAFLERAAPLPVPLSLGAGYDAAASALLMDDFFAVPSRWLALTLSTKLLPALAQIPASSDALTALEALDLRSTVGEPELESVKVRVNVFLTAPLLRRVTLWHVRGTETFPLPWSRLTDLALAYESPQVCLDIILVCASLEKATLHMSGWPAASALPHSDADSDSESAPVTLAHLASLEIHISNTSSHAHFTPFLQRLTLPSLTALKLYGEYHSGVITWSPLAFTYFQLRAPLLAHLQIDHCALTSEDLQAAVHHAPRLAHLEAYNCSNCIDDAFLAALRYTPFDPAPLAPRLEVLWLASQRCDFDESALRELVESRWWTDDELLAMSAPPTVVRLKDVSYTSSRRFSRKFEKRMQVYQMEGLKFCTLVS